MKLKYYNLDDQHLIQEAKKGKRIGIKLPDGLMPYAIQILQFLKKQQINVQLIANTCFGACDFLNIDDFDRILCIGETSMPYLINQYRPPVSFIEVTYEYPISLLEKTLIFLKEKKIGLASITPFIHNIMKCKKFLEQKNHHVYIGKKSRRTVVDGQILGCDFSTATTIANKVDTFLFIGDGFFHPLGLYLATKKPVVALNPIEETVCSNEIKKRADKVLKQRYATISKAFDSNLFGIIVTQKIGQKRMLLAKQIQNIIEDHGKMGEIILVDTIQKDIQYLNFDCFVSTACPRFAIDDSINYKKPILTPIELEVLFGTRLWEQYEFDQIL
jgi:2-(3-amino-3-carboxypropyl)histidine synthase